MTLGLAMALLALAVIAACGVVLWFALRHAKHRTADPPDTGPDEP